LRRPSDELRRLKPDLLGKMPVCDGFLEFGDVQKATVETNLQGCGRETLKEKLKPYLQTGEWSE
jgi:hypothetical protein